jgi:hypothetical protein
MANPNPVEVNNPVSLIAVISDVNTGSSDITLSEYSFNGVDWIPLIASDGAYDEVTENVEGTLGPFTEPHVYEILVRGKDVAGNYGPIEYFLLAVYDPSACFATGGGWFIPGKPGDSDSSDDKLPDLDRTSKATFGFVVKYHNGALEVPSGQLEFQYRVGDFNLHSGDYEWLVVTNNNWAKFQGLATINNTEELYPFRVDARDGDKDGGSLADRFIIKIWAPGSNPNVDEILHKASGDLGSGQIKIHRN